jgi:hypothetical protein
MTTTLAAGLVQGWDGVPKAQAGWLGLVVVLLLGLSIVVLYKSMSKQLKKIPPSFDDPSDLDDKTETPAR